MVKCWAASLGGCSAKQSGEHYLSEGLWDSETVSVRGLWLGEEKTIGFGSLNANILCTMHNSALSDLDSGIRKISDTIHELYRLGDVRAKIGRRKLSNVVELRVSGNTLERWSAKFLVGLFCVVGKDSRWHDTKTSPLQPPSEIVEAIYGLKSFENPAGLYLAYEVGDRHYHERGAVKVETLMHSNGGFVGANLDFNGFRFLMWLSQEPIKSSSVRSSAGTLFGLGAAELMYHPIKYRFRIERLVSQRLVFEWN